MESRYLHPDTPNYPSEIDAYESVHCFQVTLKDLKKSVSREQKKSGGFIVKIFLGGSLRECLDNVIKDDLIRLDAWIKHPATTHREYAKKILVK